MAAIKILKVVSPGMLTSVQDLGRYGFGRYGVAPSGALDSFSLRIANLLVGNQEDQAGLETMLLGPRIKVLDDIVIAVTGGNLQPRRNQQPIDMWRSHLFKKDDILSFYTPISGFRAYIAIGGGLSLLQIMGSNSTNIPSGFGGHLGRPLKINDILCSERTSVDLNTADRAMDIAWIPEYHDQWTLRIMWGPQHEHFSADSRDIFLNSGYKMSSDSDRTGIRLEGPEIQRKSGIPESIISEGVISGSIQIPGDGKPIIILGETVTGGYRKIATVISADLPILGQIKPGDQLQFVAVSQDEARQALRAMEDKISQFKAEIST